jgi:AcrR family transcriptional regulator
MTNIHTEFTGRAEPADHVVTERSRGGRPLDSSRDDAIVQAALELLAEIGYDRLTIDAVASRARAGKATVYRRWPSKAELVAEACSCVVLDGLDPPDSGSIRTDMIAIAEHIWIRSGPVPRAAVMAGLMSALLSNPDLRQAVQNTGRAPQSVVAPVIEAAVNRGEIPPPHDLELLSMVMPGLCMFHFAKTGIAPDSQFIESVVDRIFLPALGYRPDLETIAPATPSNTRRPKSEGKRS